MLETQLLFETWLLLYETWILLAVLRYITECLHQLGELDL